MKTPKRLSIKGEVRARVEEVVLDWIPKNPGHQVPCAKIAEKYGLVGSQVTTVLKGLVRDGKIERASRYTYKLPTPNIEKPKQAEIFVSVPDKQAVLNDQIYFLARDFHWEHNSDSLREFVDWLKVR